ncbi:hydroxypyruvate isomerase family protein [Kineococcus sp. SYSU DK002]|uniref:hydroxypyruvate isomerase family protein n=1 Tax=Kineococcus sp. SYSU DK002 TaxID=3383123 RepID=UPI003D7C565C
MLYQDLPFLDRFAAARADGFTGVEYVGAYDVPVEDLRAALDGSELALFNVPSGDWAAGERGIAALPDRVAEYRAGLPRALEHARALSCPTVNVLAGRAPRGADRARLRATLVDNLRATLEVFAGSGVQVVLEAVNDRDVPGFVVPTMADADEVRREVGPELGLQFDVYHAQVLRGDLLPTYQRYAEHVHHVQIADHPGRHEPGTGEIRYEFLLPALQAAGYSGWIGAEYVPSEAGTGWLKAFA